ncbi:MAG: tRNA-specific adenosine deaminase [Rhodospirillaceae bacterium]|mgnify:CR=1 FL=1|nr:tRNA-specific adenosine deaminase [Rhodospirillaceae bacterium]
MRIALCEARKAVSRDEVPVGAVIVDGNTGEIIARAGNRVEELHDPTAHAEIIAIRKACAALGQNRLEGCDIYVTLEPCTMCAGAISLARLRRLYFGAMDIKGGAVENGVKFFEHSTCHHVPEIYGGIQEPASNKLLKAFFQSKR